MDLDLTSRIYEAAVVPEQWPAVLGDLGALVDAPAAGIVSIDHNAGMRFLTTDAYEACYRGYAVSAKNYRNLRAERAVARSYVGFLPDTELCTLEELRADPIYTEFLYPGGLEWTIGAPVTAPASALTYFDLARELGGAPFSRADADMLDLYRPALGRAALLSVRLGLEEARSTARALSMIGLPGAVISDSGRVVAANPEFLALEPRVVVGANDRMRVTDVVSDNLFGQALISAGLGDNSIGSVPVKSDGGEPPLVLHLVPIRGRARDVFVRAAYVVVVTPVLAPQAPLADVLSALFDLTPSEARVARMLASGGSPQQIADESQLSVQTVRNQLKAVLTKTGTHRQSELVRLLLSAGPIAGS